MLPAGCRAGDCRRRPGPAGPGGQVSRPSWSRSIVVVPDRVRPDTRCYSDYVTNLKLSSPDSDGQPAHDRIGHPAGRASLEGPNPVTRLGFGLTHRVRAAWQGRMWGNLTSAFAGGTTTVCLFGQGGRGRFHIRGPPASRSEGRPETSIEPVTVKSRVAVACSGADSPAATAKIEAIDRAAPARRPGPKNGRPLPVGCRPGRPSDCPASLS